MPQQVFPITINRQRWFEALSLPNEETRMLLEIVSIGCMISSAVASPILFELQTTRTWIIDILIFFIGSACFILQNQEEIKQYGPYALAAYTCFGLGAYSSTRTTLPEFVPWMPTSLCVSFLLTVFLPPKIRELRAASDDSGVRMEEGRIRDFQRSPVLPGSIQSDGDIQLREQTLMTRQWLQNHERDMAFTLGRPASRYSSQSIHDSTISLGAFEGQPYREEITLRSQQAEISTGTHTQALPDTMPTFQQTEGAEPRFFPRSISPASMSDGSEGRLLL